MNDKPFFMGKEIEQPGCGRLALENSARYFVQSLQTKNSAVAPLPPVNKMHHTIKRYSLVRIAKAFAVGLVLFSSTTFAKVKASEEMCLAYTALSRTIMTARQEGVAIEVVLKAVKGDDLKPLVLIAYGRTRYLSFEYQQRAIDEFAAETYVECMK